MIILAAERPYKRYCLQCFPLCIETQYWHYTSFIYPLLDQVYVEGLVYTDGSKNDSGSHAWHVHNEIPGKDFFNWTGRCLSAGGHFNPYRISKEDG